MTEPAKPTLDIPLSEAVQGLTGFEVIAIQERYRTTMEHLGAIKLTLGTVWAWENRTTKTSWPTVESRTLKDLNGYFAAEPDDTDAEEPDSELGKRSSPGDGRTGS
jgi:hypothetical protein